MTWLHRSSKSKHSPLHTFSLCASLQSSSYYSGFVAQSLCPRFRMAPNFEGLLRASSVQNLLPVLGIYHLHLHQPFHPLSFPSSKYWDCGLDHFWKCLQKQTNQSECVIPHKIRSEGGGGRGGGDHISQHFGPKAH